MKEWTLSGSIAAAAFAALVGSQLAFAAGPFAHPERVREYDLQVSHKNLVAANKEVDADDLAMLKPDGSLAQYPIADFPWHTAEEALNAYPQFLGRVDGIDLPFYYVPAESRKAPVLLLTQSTPGSILQLLATVDSLTHPARHGGKAADAYTVVIAALPGSSFSSLTRSATSDIATAKLWNELLTVVIGVPRYQVYGEGLGAGAMAQLQKLYPRSVSASKAGRPPAAADDQLLADLLLSRLDQNGMERNMRLFAGAQTHGDQGFWPNAISNPIVLAKMKVEVSDAIKGKNKGAATE
ncbi:epoxide hydrolase N-terminal domain-containing protein [Hydrocarboniphaga sp.]|uniref:epoxide hydrolase N-terminal domain-containing protein n=1 Tax=Hydrocarboniphaga sp. TaxID=2033016 RepID=UPI003D0B1C75